MPQNNRFDQRMRAFLNEETASQFPIVKAVESGYAGSARLVFADEVVLEIFPDDSLVDESEYWRLFQPNIDGEHFVVNGNGIEIENRK